MPLTPAQAKANKKYQQAHYGQIRFAAPKEEIERIKVFAASIGETTNGFIRKSVNQTMENLEALQAFETGDIETFSGTTADLFDKILSEDD